MYLCSEIGYYWTFRENSNSLSHTIPTSRNMLIAAEGFMQRYPALLNILMSMIRIILVELLQSMEWGHIEQHVIVCIIIKHLR